MKLRFTKKERLYVFSCRDDLALLLDARDRLCAFCENDKCEYCNNKKIGEKKRKEKTDDEKRFLRIGNGITG